MSQVMHRYTGHETCAKERPGTCSAQWRYEPLAKAVSVAPFCFLELRIYMSHGRKYLDVSYVQDARAPEPMNRRIVEGMEITGNVTFDFYATTGVLYVTDEGHFSRWPIAAVPQLDAPPEIRQTCTCEIFSLMHGGCICGGFQAEGGP